MRLFWLTALVCPSLFVGLGHGTIFCETSIHWISVNQTSMGLVYLFDQFSPELYPVNYYDWYLVL